MGERNIGGEGADETRSFSADCLAGGAWEQEDNRRTVVVIGTDILKGIVPVEGSSATGGI